MHFYNKLLELSMPSFFMILFTQIDGVNILKFGMDGVWHVHFQHAALVGGPNAVNCPQCTKLFLNGEQLMEHMKFTHRDPNASGVAGEFLTENSSFIRFWLIRVMMNCWNWWSSRYPIFILSFRAGVHKRFYVSMTSLAFLNKKNDFT